MALFFGVLALTIPFVLIPYKNAHLLAIEIGFFLFVAAFITIMSIFIYEVHYLNKLSRAMQKVANGDFSVRLPVKKYDLLFKSFGNFNKMAAELDSTQTLKTDFISHFSHEFKTPITSINGFAELLLHQDIPEEKRKEYLQIIAEESKRLSKLSRQTLRLTKLENQKIIINQKNVEIDEELRKIIISAMSSLDSKNLNYELDLDKVNYHTDPELLREVWINLLNNSIKFTPKGGTVFISCKQDKDRVEVVIGNNGPQIAEADRKKIFDKFYQGDTTEKHAGLGLGLGIVRQVLILIGGKISIKSSYQKVEGTFFEVVL